MKLHEIVKQRNDLVAEREQLKIDYEENKSRLDSKIKTLMELENIGSNNIDIDKVLIAENVMRVEGNIYGLTEGKSATIAYDAIIDIANGCPKLKKEYFGNKTYSGYYQRCDCSYGYGPSHGGIVDRIGLKDEYRKSELSDDEKDACIYYLKNYDAIVASKKLVTS